MPQILINKESLGQFNFDVELLGNSDDIVEELCCRLGEDWMEDVPFSHGHQKGMYSIMCYMNKYYDYVP